MRQNFRNANGLTRGSRLNLFLLVWMTSLKRRGKNKVTNGSCDDLKRCIDERIEETITSNFVLYHTHDKMTVRDERMDVYSSEA